MKETPLGLHDPIAALATPWGKSALAVVRTSGEGCIDLIDSLFSASRPLRRQAGYTLLHGFIIDPISREKIDEALAAVFRAPHSFTGEDAVELSLHGGLPTIAAVLGLLRRHGFRDAAPGEFSLRAFRNGKLDLSAAEAVNEIVNAQTDRARALALSRLAGSVYNRIDGIKRRLVETLAGLEAMIDYPDETYEHAALSHHTLAETATDITSLLATYAAGRIFQEGACAAVAGRTNAGKSTLFNLLLKEDRSIVSDIPGTTRDFIEGAITVSGIPLRIFDTAGLRTGGDAIEEEGIRRTRSVLERADIVIYLVDSTVGITDEDIKNLSSIANGRKLIRVWNKIDLSLRPAPVDFIPLSAHMEQGLAELEAAIRLLLVGDISAEKDAPIIDSLRQKEALARAKEAIERTAEGIAHGVSYDLLAADLREAINELGAITGEVTSTEILERVFSTFCVGK